MNERMNKQSDRCTSWAAVAAKKLFNASLWSMHEEICTAGKSSYNLSTANLSDGSDL